MLSKNLNSFLKGLCDENDIVVVQQRNYQIMQHAFKNTEVTSQVSLLADIAKNVDIEIHNN